MWKCVSKSRLGRVSSKMWNGVFIDQEFRVYSKSLGFTAPRVHMTATGSTEFLKGENKVTPVLPVRQMERFSLPIESQIATSFPMEVKLSELMKKFSKLKEELGELETMEGEQPDHEYGRKKMELLARVEPLYHEVKNYEFSAQSAWESFLISATLPRLEFQLKKRRSCDTETTDPLGEIPLDRSSQIPKNSGKFLELNRLREAYPRISQIGANLVEFWKSSSFPLEPEYFLDDDLLEDWECLVRKSVSLLESTIQEYPDDAKEVASSSPSPEPGKYFDAVELLSRFPGDLIRNNGDRVALNQDTFKGKHVMVCCFHVPVFSSENHMFQCLVNLCNELYSTRDDFEMVMVARMNDLANFPEVFDHFFSGFPGSCLAVPFEDKIRCDYICQVLNLSLRFHEPFECLLLNTEGIVSHIGERSSDYGAEAFPFTMDIIDRMRVEQQALVFKKEGNWLERVLRCNDSSPDFVYRFDPEGGPREEVPISELGRDRHVGLYLCCGEGLCLDILAMYEQCREKQLEFEVVVVYMPFARNTDPKIFQENIDATLLKKHNVRGWWCLPFNNSVSQRFSRITYYYNPDYDNEDHTSNDKLIVVGPGVDRLDIYSDVVMRLEGIDAFPFSRDAAVKARVKKFREFTVESLFVDNEVSVFRGNDGSDSRKVGQLLQGKKKVIVCIDCLRVPGHGGSDFKALASIYNRTKAVEKEGFEMVFVARPDLTADYEHRREIPSHEMPWYICPTASLNSTKLEQLMSLIADLDIDEDLLIGFGEDGRVCSCQRIVINTCDPPSQFSMDDTLYHDISRLLGYFCCSSEDFY